METKLLMGNRAMALAAVAAGVTVATGYPGTPSTEVIETIAKLNPGDIHVEWSVNEKSAMEVAAGASYAGARTIVTMKQVGLNVASDPLMSLAYVGIKGGMVVLVADDPGPVSSQTEQDTRTFASYSKLPIFDPSSPKEAYEMMLDAFELSEKYHTPVLLRPTTRVCHSCEAFEPSAKRDVKSAEGFTKDGGKWVIFPRLSFMAHEKIEQRNANLRTLLSEYDKNFILHGSGKKGVATGGISFEYTREALQLLNIDCPVLKISTPFPFPEKLALEFMSGLDEIIVAEELDPVIERELVYICGKHGIKLTVRGKLTGDTVSAGENSVQLLCRSFSEFFGVPNIADGEYHPPEKLPVRPPVLCAGCPHRASFYAVKKAMKGKKAFFGGDIGCYTLGNAMPLDMVDTCLCMGAGITVAQGIGAVEPGTVCFSFTGDSTFFHTGIAGIVNAVYNKANMVAVILDNSTTAMTGQQPNPSTGFNAMGEIAQRIDIEAVLRACGVELVLTANPFELSSAVDAVKRAADFDGVSAVIFRAPCIAVSKPKAAFTVDSEKCTGCGKCIREIGCPAIVRENGTVSIDSTLCYGCSLCALVCPFNSIKSSDDKTESDTNG